MNKKWWMGFALLSIPLVSASNLGEFLQSTFNSLVYIGQLQFLGISSQTMVVGFIRLLIWIMMFTVFFAVIPSIGKNAKNPNVPGALSFLSRKHAGIVAFCVATIAAVFLPAQALLAMGAGWSTLIALALIGGPIIGLGYLLWRLPGRDQNNKPLPETRGTITIKFVLCLVMLWILTAMGAHLRILGA